MQELTRGLRRATIPAVLVLAAFFAWGTIAQAQTSSQVVPKALPTVPGAHRAVHGGLTAAHPSLPAAPGMSPLEPYLVTWLLPVAGVMTVLAGFYVDRRMLARRPRGRAAAGTPERR